MTAPVLYLVHDSGGAILRTGRCPAGLFEAQAGPGETVIDIASEANDVTHYFDTATGAVRAKPALGAVIDIASVLANGADAATISNLPSPTEYRVSGTAFAQGVVTDGTLALTFDATGDYRVRLRAANRLDQEIALRAS